MPTGLPFGEAIAFFRGKLNIPTERWTDLLGEHHDWAFMVAGAAKADLLQDLREAVEDARERGISLDQFRKDFDEIVERHGWDYTGGRNWRTRVIYQTNLRTSNAAGRWRQIQEIRDRRPYVRYRHGGSLDPREEHLAWDGLVLPADDPWLQTHAPPNGWGCSCYLESLSEDDLRRLGKDAPDTAPPEETYEWTDPRTGEVRQIPAGIDPGFDYAPGASLAADRARIWEGMMRRLPTSLRRMVERVGSGE